MNNLNNTNLYGHQYKKDDNFKARARLHQSIFRKNVLGAEFKDYGNRLSEKDASKGKMFYDRFNIFEKAKQRYPYKYSSLYFDMLRSEHIPFNIFIPLKHDKLVAKDIFNRYLNGNIKEILNIKIEYAPEPKEDYLNDNTSFDAYIELRDNDDNIGIVGIEIKYTEKSYSYGKKERQEIFNEKSIYNTLTSEIDIYKPEYRKQLRKPEYKQFWRNHLLGEKILQKNAKYKFFVSLLFFPKGNEYTKNVSRKYNDFLKNEYSDKFISITYEKFIEIIRKTTNKQEYLDWAIYLEKRYIIRQENDPMS